MKKLVLAFALLLFASAAHALDGKQCVAEFKLKGKTDQQFKEITLNQWNNILPVTWVDKGGHFLTRMQEVDRGQSAAVYTPAELEGFFRRGKLLKDSKNKGRYFVVVQETKKYSVVFDVNTSSSKCELVTFLITSP